MLVIEKRSQAPREGKPLTTTAAAPEGCRQLLTQVMVLQQSEIQQARRSPSTVVSEPGWPADDTSRRPVLPAGVGPMIDVQSGEARVPYIAGIAAHDEGGGALNTDFKSLLLC